MFSPKILFVSSSQRWPKNLFGASKFSEKLLKSKQIKKHCLDDFPNRAVKQNIG